MIKIIPTWVWLAAIAVSGVVGYALAYDSVTDKWEAQKIVDRAATEKDKMFRDVSTSVTQTVFVEKIKTITIQAKARVEYREKLVPSDSGMLLGGFRLFHDASATDTLPDTSSGIDAAPVSVADVAATLDTNYTLCHKAYATVEAWQDWATRQCALNPKGCPNE